MKAVNLTPAGHRGGGGTAVYGLLGALALVVLLVGAYAMTGKSIRDTQAQVASAKAKADAAEAKAADLKPYGDFAAMRKQRTDTVTQLATTRFDWAHVLHEVARTIPGDTSLSTLHGNTDSSAANGTPAPATTGTTGAPATPDGPTVDISGCTGGQAATARLMVALRRIDGVQDVKLSASQADTASASSASSTSKGSASTAGDCTGKRTTFSMTLKFRPQAAAATPAATTASTGSTTP